MLRYIIAFFIEAFLSVFFTTCSINMLRQGKNTALNYSGANVPFPIGIAYVPVLAASQLLYLSFFSSQYNYDFLLFSFSAAATAFSGLLDDLAGQKGIKGFRGHFEALLQGRITTGIAKISIGFIVSLLSSAVVSRTFFELLLNMLTVMLFMNSLNLLDVRPGRCIKAFLLVALIFFPSSLEVFPFGIPLYFITIQTAILFHYDLKEKGMLGDTGSNLLGFVLGWYTIRYLPFNYKLPVLTLLIVLNAVSEKKSLTAIIENNKLLKYFDSLGRKKHEAS